MRVGGGKEEIALVKPEIFQVTGYLVMQLGRDQQEIYRDDGHLLGFELKHEGLGSNLIM